MNLHTSVEAKTNWKRIRWQMSIYILMKGIITRKVEELFPHIIFFPLHTEGGFSPKK